MPVRAARPAVLVEGSVISDLIHAEVPVPSDGNTAHGTADSLTPSLS